MSKGEKAKSPKVKRQPTLVEAVLMLVLLVALFGCGVIFGINYVVMMVIVTAVAALIGVRCGYTWAEMEDAAARKIKKAASVTVLLLAVGAMMGALLYSGTLPMVIYFGLKIISPRWIALSAFLLCAVFSTFTGTSNGSVSTAGLAMIGVAMSMGDAVNIGLVAGAIYAGAMFGDKMSPLSDTTILAAMATDNDIFAHIKHMFKTVGPAAAISIIIYLITGIMQPASNVVAQSTTDLLNTLNAMYNWNILLLIPLAIVLWGAITKKSSTMIIFVAAFSAVIIGPIVQGFSLADGLNSIYEGFKPGMALSARPGFELEMMSPDAVTLLTRGGIDYMLKSFIMAFICLYFAGIVEESGALDVILNRVLGFVRSTGSLIVVSGFSTLLLTAVGGSSTVSLLVVGEMYKSKFKQMGLSTLNLSRTLEDFGTGSTGFFPWTGSGILYATVLGVSNLTFLKYSFFSWIIWILAIVYGFTGIGIKKLEPETEAEPVTA